MRQYRIKLSDRAWELVSAAAARQHKDRGQLIDEIIIGEFGSATELMVVSVGHEDTPEHRAAGGGYLIPKPPSEPPDAALPYLPAPKPAPKSRAKRG